MPTIKNFKGRVWYYLVVLLGLGLILTVADNMQLRQKLKLSMQIATICEVEAHKAKLKTNQPIAEKEFKGELKPLEKEFLKEFNKEADKVVNKLYQPEREDN